MALPKHAPELAPPDDVLRDPDVAHLLGSPEHQGVCAEVSDYPYADALALLVADDALVLCLDQVQDPHNLGAVCRVAECAEDGADLPAMLTAVVQHHGDDGPGWGGGDRESLSCSR